MYYVYLLESLGDTSKRYVGLTSKGIDSRLNEHNAGKSIHTNKHKPWRCFVCVMFQDKGKAERFEAYLKQGSGHAFAKRHFW
jgi:predicted GIY-YIG superfamily endonuclease